MDINFSQVPSAIRVPGSYVEINATQSAQQTGENQKILVFGQRLTTGTVAELTPTLVTSKAQAIANFGRGSMLANMLSTLFDNNTETEKWVVAQDDDAAGTAAAGTITVTVSSNLAGTISLYLGGVLVSVSCAAGDTATTIGTAIRDAINANLELPVTATNSAGVVTVTFRHKGLVGNKYNMQANFRGQLAGEVTPSGVTLAFVQLTGGATDPAIAAAWAVMPDEIYSYVVMPYIASANLNAMDTELDDRWGPSRMLEGHAFVCDRGSVGTMSTLGNSRNNEHMTLFDAGLNSPTPPWIWNMAVVGVVAKAASVDAARPFNGLELTGVLASPVSDRRTQGEQNTLLYDGVATHSVASSDGSVSIQRLITTYQLNDASIADPTYLDATTLFTLSKLRQDVRQLMSTKFPRFKLADNGTRVTPDSATITPAAIKAELIGLAGQWFNDGLIEDLEGFKANLVVQRNATDLTRVDCVMPPNLVNGFQIFAAQIKFSL